MGFFRLGQLNGDIWYSGYNLLHFFQTGAQKLTYIGPFQGTSQMFVWMSLINDY